MKNKFTKVILFIISDVMTLSTSNNLASSAKMGYKAEATANTCSKELPLLPFIR